MHLYKDCHWYVSMKKDNQFKDINVKTYVPSLIQGLVGWGISVGVVSKHIAEQSSSEIEYNLTSAG